MLLKMLTDHVCLGMQILEPGSSRRPPLKSSSSIHVGTLTTVAQLGIVGSEGVFYLL